MTTALRPLSLGELLDRTFHLYRNSFGLFVGITAVAYLPLFMIRVVYGLLQASALKGHVGAVVAMVLGGLVAALCYLVSVAAAQAATVTAVSSVYLGETVTVRETYSRVKGKIVRVVLTMVGMGIGIGIGLLLLIVPGIILALMWSLTIPVVVLEDADLFEALRRSRELTVGHRGRVFLIVFLFALLTYLFSILWEAPLVAMLVKGGVQSMQQRLTNPAFTIATDAMTFVTEALLTPLMTIAFSLMYYDERVRKEAFDIQLMMSSPVPGEAQPAASGLS
jgi:Membrane domain of glycerophosphoryl diester phosphodiesterase